MQLFKVSEPDTRNLAPCDYVEFLIAAEDAEQARAIGEARRAELDLDGIYPLDRPMLAVPARLDAPQIIVGRRKYEVQP